MANWLEDPWEFEFPVSNFRFLRWVKLDVDCDVGQAATEADGRRSWAALDLRMHSTLSLLCSSSLLPFPRSEAETVPIFFGIICPLFICSVLIYAYLNLIFKLYVENE